MNLPPSRFVVVEDGDEDAFILARLLERSGVTQAPVFHSGEAALEALETLAGAAADRPMPSALFVDVSLPGMNGFEVLRWIRSHQKLSSAVVILLSASDEPRNLGKAIQLGADCFMVKFPTPTVMREVLAEAARVVAVTPPRPVLQVSGNLLLAATGRTGSRSPFKR